MSKCDIRSELNDKIGSNDKMQYLSRIRKSKQDFECQNEIFGLNSNVKIGIAIFDPILMTKSDIKRRTAIIGPISKVK